MHGVLVDGFEQDRELGEGHGVGEGVGVEGVVGLAHELFVPLHGPGSARASAGYEDPVVRPDIVQREPTTDGKSFFLVSTSLSGPQSVTMVRGCTLRGLQNNKQLLVLLLRAILVVDRTFYGGVFCEGEGRMLSVPAGVGSPIVNSTAEAIMVENA